MLTQQSLIRLHGWAFAVHINQKHLFLRSRLILSNKELHQKKHLEIAGCKITVILVIGRTRRTHFRNQHCLVMLGFAHTENQMQYFSSAAMPKNTTFETKIAFTPKRSNFLFLLYFKIAIHIIQLIPVRQPSSLMLPTCLLGMILVINLVYDWQITWNYVLIPL